MQLEGWQFLLIVTRVYQYVMKVRFCSCSHVACDHALAISVCLSCKVEIFMAFYCVARKRPVKREKSKLETSFRFARFSRQELLLVSTQFKSKCSRSLFYPFFPVPPPRNHSLYIPCVGTHHGSKCPVRVFPFWALVHSLPYLPLFCIMYVYFIQFNHAQ